MQLWYIIINLFQQRSIDMFRKCFLFPPIKISLFCRITIKIEKKTCLDIISTSSFNAQLNYDKKISYLLWRGVSFYILYYLFSFLFFYLFIFISRIFKVFFSSLFFYDDKTPTKQIQSIISVPLLNQFYTMNNSIKLKKTEYYFQLIDIQ